MRKKTPLVLPLFALLAIGAVAAGYVYLRTLGEDQYRDIVVGAIERATGRTAVVEGSLEARLSLSPTLVVTQVQLANAPWGSQPNMAKIERLEVQLQLLPLLRGIVHVDRLAASGGKLWLETNAAGQGNWMFNPPSPVSGGFWAVRGMQIDDVRIEGLDIAFRNGVKGTTTQAHMDHFAAAPESSSDELQLQAQGRINDLPVTLTGTAGRLGGLLQGNALPIAISVQVADTTFEARGILADARSLSGIDLQTHAEGTNLARLAESLAIHLPETEHFAVGGHLTGAADSLRAQDIRGTLRQADTQFKFDGDVDDLNRLSGIDLRISVSGDDFARLGEIFGETLPDTERFQVAGRLTGKPSALAFQDAHIELAHGGLTFALDGDVRDLGSVRGLDARLHAAGPNLAALGKLIGKPMPTTGPFSLSGRLSGDLAALALTAGKATASVEGLSLNAQGEVADLNDLRGIDAQVAIAGSDLARLKPLVGVALPSSGPFSAQGRLVGSAKALSVKGGGASLRYRNASANLTGDVGDLLTLTGLNLKVDASSKAFKDLDPLIGADLPELGAFRLEGRLTGSSRNFVLEDFLATAGNTDLSGFANIKLSGRPKVTLRLNSGLVDFSPLMERLEREERKGLAGERATLFSSQPIPLHALGAVDADVMVEAKRIRAREAQLEFGQLTFTLDKGELRLDRLEGWYKKTKLSATAELSASSPPRLATKFLVQDFDLGAFLKEVRSTDQVRGHVDMAGDLKSRGRSPREIMGNLDGEFGAIMGRGRFSKFLDLLAADLSRRVIPFWGTHERAGNIRCAVVDFGIQQGIATSKAFAIDTDIAVLTGGGTINLGTERLDFSLLPTPKDPSLFSLATELRVSGSLNDPVVRPDTVALAKKGAKLLSTLVVGPVGLLAPFATLGAQNRHPCDVKGLLPGLTQDANPKQKRPSPFASEHGTGP